MIPFIEKYRPRILNDLKGQDKPISDLKNLVENYKPGKAIMVYGKTGTGKTNAVCILAEENDLELVEINASDLRNQNLMESKILNAVKQKSLFGKNKLILIDDVEAFSGISDRGGLATLSSVIDQSVFPIVMTVTDPWDKKLNTIRKKSNLIGFRALSHVTIFNVLNEINLKENLKIDKEKLIEISKKNEGDIRGAINDLQSVTEGDLASRERKVDIFQVLKKVLKNRDDNILEILNDMDVTFEDYLLWMDENIPREYNHEELLKAYERLSRADVFRGRVMKWQYYRYLVYHMFLMSTGVSFAKKEPKIGFTSYQKPQRILKMFIAKQRYGKKRAISEKIAEKTHTSTKRVLDNFEDYIGILENKEVVKYLDLSNEEIDWLKR